RARQRRGVGPEAARYRRDHDRVVRRRRDDDGRLPRDHDERGAQQPPARPRVSQPTLARRRAARSGASRRQRGRPRQDGGVVGAPRRRSRSRRRVRGRFDRGPPRPRRPRPQPRRGRGHAPARRHAAPPRPGRAPPQTPRQHRRVEPELPRRDRSRHSPASRGGVRLDPRNLGRELGPVILLEHLARTLTTLLREDERRIVLGEDVADGGLLGLTREAAADPKLATRLVGAPLSPVTALAQAAGAALGGSRPIVVLPSATSLVEGLAGLREAALLGWRLGTPVPLLVLTPCGPGFGLGGDAADAIETLLT